MNTNTTKQDWKISEIEALSENGAKSFAIEAMQIKGHDVYFVDFGGYFGYSALVFADGHHIHYANEYELHHKYAHLDHEGLKAEYIQMLNRKLYTEDEITSPIRSYGELKSKWNYMNNYYGMRRDHTSIFHVGNDAPKKHGKYYNPVCYAYYDDEAFVDKCVELFDALQAEWKKCENDFDVMKQAFIYEMCNHEYAINYQGDWDVLSCFGNIEWKGDDYATALNSYFEQLNFNTVKREAYFAAREQYFNEVAESGAY